MEAERSRSLVFEENSTKEAFEVCIIIYVSCI